MKERNQPGQRPEQRKQRSRKGRVEEHQLSALRGIAGLAVIIFALNACDPDPTPTPTVRAAATNTPSATATVVSRTELTPRPAETKTPPTPTAVAPTATSEPKIGSTPVPPTETPEPEATETPSPEPTEVAKAPDLGVRYDPNTEKCVPVDKDTGKAVDISNALPIERISYQETGVGAVKDISITLQPGQTAIIQGWKVDGKGDGVFKAVTATEDTLEFSVNISDGAVEIVDSQNGPFIFCRAVNIAVDKGYAHEKVEIPEAWKVNQ